MLLTRRLFLLKSGMASAAAMLMQHVTHKKEVIARPAVDANALAHFVDPLPIPEVAKASGLRADPRNPSVKIPYYRMAMRQFESKVHRDLKPTRQWGIGSAPGLTLEARSGQPVLVEWANELPTDHFLPIDHTLHGAERDKPNVRAVMHVHGAKVPPESDGYPEDWYVPGKSATYYYPNHQDAALLWYHDHTMAINRLNIYAGLLGLYIVRDGIEDALNLPGGKYEIPLVFYDRMFDPQGQLIYPTSADPDSPWIPEFFGDALLVNGKLFPYLEVEPRKYRFRVLNGSNSRFLALMLPGQLRFQQIGTDQGLLPAPVPIGLLQLAPGERADLVLDFTGLDEQQIVLKNDALPAMQFRVAKASKSAIDASALPKTLRPVAKIPESDAVKTRILSLGELDNKVDEPTTMLLNNMHWSMPITEKPVLDSVEIWSLVNVTDDSHPIHLHLVRFQILDRRRFDTFQYQTQGTIRYTGPATAPEPGEAGWKDTVRADPGMVTRIIVRFEGYTGRYVWHCHILEHEDNEMMRPYEVVAKP